MVRHLIHTSPIAFSSLFPLRHIHSRVLIYLSPHRSTFQILVDLFQTARTLRRETVKNIGLFLFILFSWPEAPPVRILALAENIIHELVFTFEIILSWISYGSVFDKFQDIFFVFNIPAVADLRSVRNSWLSSRN